MRLLAVSDGTSVDVGELTLGALRERFDVIEVSVRQPAHLRRRIGALLGAGVGLVRGPSRTLELRRASSGDARSFLRSLHLAGRGATVAYFPRPELALGYEPLSAVMHWIVGIPAGGSRGIGGSRRAVLEHADVILVPFDSDRDQLEEVGVNPERIHVAPVGFDPVATQPARTRPVREGVHIVCVHPMDWRSALEDLLVATRRAADRGARVTMELFGGGAERNRVVHAVDDLGLTDTVTLRPRPTPSNLEGAIGQATAFVDLDLVGAVDRSTLVAMRAGVPVIATSTGAVTQLVRDGIEGLLVPYGDVDALTSSLFDLDADRSRTAGIGQQARRRIADVFAPRAQAHALVEAVAIAHGEPRTMAQTGIDGA